MNQLDVIKDIIVSNCDWVEKESLRYDTTFAVLGFDSMDIASIMLGIEDHFSLKIPNSEIKDLDTIEKIANYVNLLSNT